jgi:membrane-bound serine protease (ClpP class)
MRNIFVFILIIISTLKLFSNNDDNKKIIYKFDINRDIGKASWRLTKKAFKEATEYKADYIILRLNTYGGTLDAADSIRTKILNSPIPVLVFIDNNAASAGALIAIACDSIYMRKGSSIGAATVVDQTGTPMPDKYQSFMRSMMRATAETHGYDTIISGNDTVIRWKRDPKIAEAMVDPSVKITGIIDSGKVLTFTATEALKNNYCEGIAENIKEVIEKAGINNYELKEYRSTAIDAIISFFLNPIVQGILIMLIIGGIYFELQTPGIGFPLILAITAALLYFTPLYLEGLADNWEVLIFIAGIILLALEIFVIPGFGITGITGIILIILGLTFAMVDKITWNFKGEEYTNLNEFLKSLLIVLTSITVSFILSLYLGKKLFTAKAFKGLALDTDQNISQGYIGVETQQFLLKGKSGISYTPLRPSGKVLIDGEIYDAISEIGFIEKGQNIIVTRYETGQIYVIKN